MSHSRRHFLLGTGTAMALGSLPLLVSARERLQVQGQQHTGLTVYREALQPARYFAAVMAEAGMDVVGLLDDPVRQWRDSLAAMIAATDGPVYGLTDWADYQLLRGLCAEQRRHPRHEARHALAENPQWGAELALTLLDTHSLPENGAEQVASRQLFSWVLA